MRIPAWIKQANALLESNRFAEALSIVDDALAHDPAGMDNVRVAALAHSLRGTTLHALGRLEEAAHEQESALALDATNAGIWERFALLQRDQKRYAEALASIERAVDLDAQVPLIWQSKASVLVAMGRWEEAIRAFDQQLALVPSNAAEVLTCKSELLADLRHYEEALAVATAALEALEALGAATAARASGALGTVGAVQPEGVGALGVSAEAAAEEEGTGPVPGLARALHARGLALRGLRCYEEAVQAFDQAIRLEPNALELWKNKYATLVVMRRFRAAFATLRASLPLYWAEQQQRRTARQRPMLLHNIGHRH